MNWLVYKDKVSQPPEQDLSVFLREKLHVTQQEVELMDNEEFKQRAGKDAWKTISQLSNKQSNDSQQAGRASRLTYKEWLKLKDAEKRLKRKLITQAQEEVRQTLLQMASNEQQAKEKRLKDIDQWLDRKKHRLMRDETTKNERVEVKKRFESSGEADREIDVDRME